MQRRELLAILGAATLGAPALGAADAPADGDGSHLDGVPRTTVEELRAAIRREGFRWRHIGRQIAFTGTVLAAGDPPRVRIDGMDEGRLDTAWLHSPGQSPSLEVGGRVRVQGLIADQDFGVWRIWAYHLSADRA